MTSVLKSSHTEISRKIQLAKLIFNIFLTTAKRNSNNNNIYTSKYYKTKSWKENYIWRILISFKCKFWINECVISVLLYNFISTRHLSRSLMSSSLDFNKNSRLCHELCHDIDCTVKIALVQKMRWCKYCIHAKIVLVQEMCWCKECADAKIVLWHKLHWCKNCADAKIVLWYWLHWCKECAGAKIVLWHKLC